MKELRLEAKLYGGPQDGREIRLHREYHKGDLLVFPVRESSTWQPLAFPIATIKLSYYQNQGYDEMILTWRFYYLGDR